MEVAKWESLEICEETCDKKWVTRQRPTGKVEPLLGIVNLWHRNLLARLKLCRDFKELK